MNGECCRDIVYASKVAFGVCGEVTPTGESLSQMVKEIGKSFSKEGFKRPCLPAWMKDFSKKMAVNLPSHRIGEAGFHLWENRTSMRSFNTGAGSGG